MQRIAVIAEQRPSGEDGDRLAAGEADLGRLVVLGATRGALHGVLTGGHGRKLDSRSGSGSSLWRPFSRRVARGGDPRPGLRSRSDADRIEVNPEGNNRVVAARRAGVEKGLFPVSGRSAFDRRSLCYRPLRTGVVETVRREVVETRRVVAAAGPISEQLINPPPHAFRIHGGEFAGMRSREPPSQKIVALDGQAARDLEQILSFIYRGFVDSVS